MPSRRRSAWAIARRRSRHRAAEQMSGEISGGPNRSEVRCCLGSWASELLTHRRAPRCTLRALRLVLYVPEAQAVLARRNSRGPSMMETGIRRSRSWSLLESLESDFATRPDQDSDPAAKEGGRAPVQVVVF
eukprot:567870-Rhodomonas_salina.1